MCGKLYEKEFKKDICTYSEYIHDNDGRNGKKRKCIQLDIVFQSQNHIMCGRMWLDIVAFGNKTITKNIIWLRNVNKEFSDAI